MANSGFPDNSGATPPRKKYPNNRRNPKDPKQPNGGWIVWVIVGFILLIMMSQNNTMTSVPAQNKMTYSRFYNLLVNNPQDHQIAKLELVEGAENNVLRGTRMDGSTFSLYIPKDDKEILKLIRANVEDFDVVPAQTFWTQLFFSFAPLVIILFFIWFLSQRGAQMGNKIWSFGKSKAQVAEKGETNVTFKDVAGVDEAKEELQEVIEFLKDPKKFERLGGKIPKGVLLIGPPGTGKTLLAKAVAGEAGVPFFSLSGSDFVEMFVGVGASRVRDLFEQGRKASKTSGKGAIIFIDEIDAVGRLRFAGIGGGNDEREQTLNALLVEMDGFKNTTGLILIAATNRPDTLDPALLRPGRFDRRVVVGLPDLNGREGILKVHAKSITLAKDVDLRKIAQQTVYFSGADLANVCNEAALLAARRNKKAVGQQELVDAVERVTMGPEKKSRTISEREKSMTAYHEAGHALLSLLVDNVDTFSKVSIVPRGMAGGYTLTPPTEDKHYFNKSELMGQMTVLLGGMIAEEIYTGVTSTGVSNDLEKVAQIARNMVCVYGMSDILGPLAYGEREHQTFLGRDLMEQRNYSEETSRLIDEEVRRLVGEAQDRARMLLTEHRDKLEKIAEKLIEKEIMDVDETRVLLGMTDTEQSPSKEENESSDDQSA